jgi:hypothetical protein
MRREVEVLSGFREKPFAKDVCSQSNPGPAYQLRAKAARDSGL